MKEKDLAANKYFRDNRRFADVMNVGLFGGEKIVRAECLKDKDVFAGSMEGKRQKKTGVLEYRDVIKKSMFGVNFAILGVENQTDIHYAMPARIMGYDYLSYKEQLQEIRKRHREDKDLSGAEYTSGFSKTDKLHPTLTLIIYYGKEPWDGPGCLSEILDWTQIPEKLRKLVVDYPIYVLDVQRFQHTEELSTDVELLFGVLQRRENKKELQSYVEERREIFSDIPEDTYDMLEAFTNINELKKIHQNKKEKGGKNMDFCKALEDLQSDARTDGIQQSIIELLEMKEITNEKVKQKIFSQRDNSILKEWLKIAAVSNSVEEFLQKI